jgi:hypothetical protein
VGGSRGRRERAGSMRRGRADNRTRRFLGDRVQLLGLSDMLLVTGIWGVRGAGFANNVDGDVNRLAEASCWLAVVGQLAHLFIPYENKRMRVGAAGVVCLNQEGLHL